MAISEITKQAIARQRATLKQTIDANQADIAAHQAAIDEIRARNVALKAEFDALKADIAEPTPIVP